MGFLQRYIALAHVVPHPFRVTVQRVAEAMKLRGWV